MVGAIGEQWLEKNDGRDYPLVDGSDVLIPTDLIVDMHVAFLPVSSSSRLYFSKMEITKPRAVIEISDTVVGPLLELDVEGPVAFRNYLCKSVGGAVAHGFVCFGSAVDSGTVSFKDLSLAVSDAEILPSRVVRMSSTPYTDIALDGRRIVGNVVLRGEGGINLDYRDGRIFFELENSISVLEAPLRACQIPLEAGRIPDGESWPFLRVNGVYPTIAGTLNLHINLDDPDLADFSVESGVLCVEGLKDYTEFCLPKARKIMVDYGPGCSNCTYTVEIHTGDSVEFFTPHRVFIHRKWLVIEWAYGGASDEADAGAPITIVLGEDLVATLEAGKTQKAKPIKLVYDRLVECAPDEEPEPAEVGRLVFRLSKAGEDIVVRNTHVGVSLVLDEGCMEDDDDEKSPGFDMACIPIRDPFTFNAVYMDGDEEGIIATEIEDYRNGNPPWEEAETGP